MRGGWLPISGRNRRKAVKPNWRMSAMEATKPEIVCSVFAAPGKFSAQITDAAASPAMPTQEQPQRVQVGGALQRARVQQRDRHAERDQREPGRGRAPERERAGRAVQNRILPVSMSFHITQSPMKL